MAVEPLNDYARFPRMVHWFSPSLLLALLNNVILSSIFGRYADRRLTIAALDTVSIDEHMDRATALKTELVSDHRGVVWFDFVADLGDGFDSTYAMATLLGRKELVVDGRTLPRGQFLVMGGDDGKVVSLDAKGEVTLLASDPKRRWIDAVALHPDGAYAWSAGKTAFFRSGKSEEK